MGLPHDGGMVLLMLVPFVLAAVLIAFIVVRVTNTPPHKVQQPGWQAPVAGAVAPASVSWNAQVLGDSLIGTMGGALDSTFGRFDLREGVLSFTPNGAPGPAWHVPCNQLIVTHHGLFSTATITLRGPMGVLRCNVSVEHINRITQNSLKSMREVRHATNFLHALRANGARG